MLNAKDGTNTIISFEHMNIQIDIFTDMWIIYKQAETPYVRRCNCWVASFLLLLFRGKNKVPSYFVGFTQNYNWQICSSLQNQFTGFSFMASIYCDQQYLTNIEGLPELLGAPYYTCLETHFFKNHSGQHGQICIWF